MTFYTVGDPSVYDPIIEKNGSIIKLGKQDDYIGGIVFFDIKEATKSSVSTGYSIYILETSMDNIYQIEDSYHLKTSCLIRKKYAT